MCTNLRHAVWQAADALQETVSRFARRQRAAPSPELKNAELEEFLQHFKVRRGLLCWALPCSHHGNAASSGCTLRISFVPIRWP